MPLVCNYYLTYRCNARCVFCDVWEQPDQGSADPERVLSNLRQLPRVGVRIVDFTGGEPLLHPDLPRFLREARDVGLRTTVTTNGLLYPKRARELQGLINLLHISLDAAHPGLHNRLRGVASFDKILLSLDLALSLGEKPELLFTATSENFREVTPLAEMAGKLGVILIVNPVFGWNGHHQLLSKEQLLELIERSNRPYVYLNGGVVRLMLEGGNNAEKPRCKAVSATLVISPHDELLLPCYHHAQTKLPICGDLPAAIRSPQRKLWIERQGRAGFCRNCTINCYLAPSLLYKPDRYFAEFIPWAVKYFYYKLRYRSKNRKETEPSNPAD